MRDSMKVRELRQLLDSLSAAELELPVLVRAYEDGLNEIDRMEKVMVVDTVNERQHRPEYDGRYENLTRVPTGKGDELKMDIRSAYAKGRKTELAIYLYSTEDGMYVK